ncbi:hypothetical protein ACJRO7_004630 [Eucalyptus globulus]|uniref:Uncharacterized protein n=1 Tax=Eucalyptus globulus TaxID=34317 RepID=A0ABD3IXS9_EUCGL
MPQRDPYETNWIVEVNESLKCMPTDERQYWEKQSIYQVSTSVPDLNRNAFNPQAVSFGPSHHGKIHLRTKPLNPFLESLREVARDHGESYYGIGDWFLKLMIPDGCLMLEILRTATQEEDDYELDDPIFHTRRMLYIMPYIWPDMLMLDTRCHDFTPTTQDDEYISKIILNYCSASKDTANKGKRLHVLDVVRKSLLLHEKPKLDQVGCEGLLLVWSATELIKHGIWFKKSKTGSLTDISFAGGVLSLAEIVVEEATESMLTRNEVTSYIYFMDYIIDNECDVALLYNLGIVLTVLGDDKETMELFHLLAKYTTIEPNNSLIAVCNKVNKYCNKPWNKWRANFIEAYFRGPWALWSFMDAIFLCALAIIQTIYFVLRTYSLPLCTIIFSFQSYSFPTLNIPNDGHLAVYYNSLVSNFFIFVQSCEG